MSLLSKYYYKKFMMKTLTDRMNRTEEITDDTVQTQNIISRLSLSNETYESAAHGIFASAGEICSVR